MAEELLCEIMCQMSGIVLEEVPQLPTNFTMRKLGIVVGATIGDFDIKMRLIAERALFERLANNMIGEPAKDFDEVEEYATEFFNIVCGRFVSELYVLTGQSARFLPTTYMHVQEDADPYGESTINIVRFMSDGDEGAVFSWTLASQKV